MGTSERTRKRDGGWPSVAASHGCVARLSEEPYVVPWDDSTPGPLERKRQGERERGKQWSICMP